MRIVLFYSEIDPFNFGSDQLANEFQAKGHEVFILDLLNPSGDGPHSLACFSQFLTHKVDLVICFDGIGVREDVFVELWNSHQAAVADILLDPPFRFHPTLTRHPQNYHLFCCDLDHVEYVKKYFGQTMPHVSFMPHVGVLPKKDAPLIPYEERPYDILFTGTYYDYQHKFSEIKQLVPESSRLYPVYETVFGKLLHDSSLTIENALLCTLGELGWPVSDNALKSMMRCMESVDWAIRMYQREKVVTVLAESGLDLYLLGRGWENHPACARPNVHLIDGRIPYGQTLSYMANARINLNVMPWFKAGTHDRIFNALLQRSVPLTDSSTWIAENFTDRTDIVLYDLKQLEQLPDIAQELLTDTAQAEAVIRNGYEKAVQGFTWKNCAEWLLAI